MGHTLKSEKRRRGLGLSPAGWILGVILAAAAMATLVRHWWNESVIEGAEFGFISESAQVSRKHDLLIAEYRADPPEVRCGDRVIRVESAWLERKADVAFHWVWFFRPRATAQYRVVVCLREDGDPPGVSFTMRGEPDSPLEVKGMRAWVTNAPPETVEIEVSRDATNERASLRLVRKS